VTVTGVLLSISLSLSFSLLIESRLELGSSLSFTLPSTRSPSLSLPSLSLSPSLSPARNSLAPRHLFIVGTWPDEEAAHTSHPGTLVSSPGRVSGVHSRACTHARVHAAVRHTSVLHPNVCQRPRNFAALIRLQYYEHKRVCVNIMREFYPSIPKVPRRTDQRFCFPRTPETTRPPLPRKASFFSGCSGAGGRYLVDA